MQNINAYRQNQIAADAMKASPEELITMLLRECALLVGQTNDMVKQGDFATAKRLADKARRIIQEGLRDALRMDSEVAYILDTQYSLTLIDLENMTLPGRLLRAKRRCDELLKNWIDVCKIAKGEMAAPV